MVRLRVWFLGFGLMGASLLMPSFSADAADLNTIRERGTLIVAVKDNLRPLGFRAADGKLQGLEIEIAQRLAQELLGHPNAVVLKPVLNQERMAVVLDQQVDIAIARMTMTPMRSRVVSFSIPYYMDGTALITKDPTIQIWSDLAQHTVVVLNNSTTVDVVRNRLPGVKLIGVDSYVAARERLETGEATAFAADASILSGWVQDLPQYRLLTPLLSVEPLCIVMPKGLQYDELRQQINQILTRWQTEGWLKERSAYWQLP